METQKTLLLKCRPCQIIGLCKLKGAALGPLLICICVGKIVKLKRLSSEDFERVVELTRLQGAACGMARAVFVDGRSQAEVAAEYGVSRQRIHLAIGVIEKAYMKYAPSGHNSVRVSLDLPERIALALAAFMEILELVPQNTNREDVIAAVEQAIIDAMEVLKKTAK